MKICILLSSYEDSNTPYSKIEPDYVPELYLNLNQHTFETVQIKKATAVKQVVELCRRGFDVFINMCEGAWDEDRAGIEVVDALVRFNQAFTGGSKEFFEPSREAQKKVANDYGILAPGFRFCYDMESVKQATHHLKFPVICKHFSSYNSLGMTKKSKCSTEEELMAEAQRFIENYGGKFIRHCAWRRGIGARLWWNRLPVLVGLSRI